VAFPNVLGILGHGILDTKVPVQRGREARYCLQLLPTEVKLVEYEGLGHWYSFEMVGDILKFLKEKLHLEKTLNDE
jgi:predicted esterase